MSLYKLFAGRAIYESNLDPAEKIEHLNNVAMLEDDREVISYIANNVLSERHTLLKAGAAMAAGYGTYRGVRALLDPCQKACGTFAANDAKRIACLKKCAINKINLQIEELENQSCENSKFKKRCELVRRTRISELHKKAAELEKLSID